MSRTDAGCACKLPNSLPIRISGTLVDQQGRTYTIDGLANVVEDTTPQLGGHLDMGAFCLRGGASNHKALCVRSNGADEGNWLNIDTEEAGVPLTLETEDGSFYLGCGGPNDIQLLVNGTKKAELSSSGLDIVDWLRAQGLRVDGDVGGLASTFGVSNVTQGVSATRINFLQRSGSGSSAVVGYIKVYDGTSTRYIPLCD